MDYIYYKFHRFFNKAQGQRDGAVIAFISLSCILGLYILSLMNILQVVRILPIIELKTNYLYILATILMLACGIYFMRNRRYEKIESRFINETKRRKVIGSLIVILYILFSVVFLGFTSMLRYDMVH